jgi:glycosyltransferase involved in cell wall biosynthesis
MDDGKIFKNSKGKNFISSKKMKIVLISLSTRGAMGDYLYLLAKELVRHEKIFLIVPDYFDKQIDVKGIVKFRTGENKFSTFLSFINPLENLRLIKEIKKINPDLVHLFFGEGYPQMIFISLWLKLAKIPLVVTIHDPEIHPGNLIERINGILRIFTLKLASAVHIHSKIFKEKLETLGIQKENIFIIPHGSFAPLFSPYKSGEIKKENNILFFGRIEKYKGLEYFVEAGLRINGFKFVIAGPGKIPENLLKVIKENPQKFELKNKFLSYKEIAELFQKSKVCVLPYIQATQSSIPLISAYFNVPVVATKVGVFVEDVPLVNGVLVEPGNVDSLVKGIFEALNKKPVYPSEREFKNLVFEFLKMYCKVSGKVRDN